MFQTVRRSPDYGGRGSIAAMVAVSTLWLAVLSCQVLVIPVHASPGNGSLRCGNPPNIGLVHLDPDLHAEGLYSICESGEIARRVEVSLTLAGGLIAAVAVAFAVRRRGPRAVWILGFITGGALAFGSFLVTLANASS